MRLSRTLTSLLLLVSTMLIAQSQYHSIMLGAYTAAHLSHFSNARGVGYVYSLPVEGGIQVYSGGFEDAQLAADALAKAKSIGYTDARLITRQLDQARKATYIQLTSGSFLNPVKWDKYKGIENLQVAVQGDYVRICMGPYDNTMAAQADLAMVQEMGFTDAFTRAMNVVYLHKVSALEQQPIVAKPNPAKPIPMPAPIEETKPEPAVEQQPAPTTPDNRLTLKGSSANLGGNQRPSRLANATMSWAGYLDSTIVSNDVTLARNTYSQIKAANRKIYNYARLAGSRRLPDVGIYLEAVADVKNISSDNAPALSDELLDISTPISAPDALEADDFHRAVIVTYLMRGERDENARLFLVTYTNALLELQQHYISNGLGEDDATEAAKLVLSLLSR